jgi:DsbC/DsbD-like thiol-disulfide interchange protein
MRWAATIRPRRHLFIKGSVRPRKGEGQPQTAAGEGEPWAREARGDGAVMQWMKARVREFVKRRRRWAYYTLALLLAGCAIATAAWTAPPVTQAAFVRAPHLDVTLLAMVTARDGTGQDGHRTIWLGLRFQPEAGWHIYWRNPGDSGAPPMVKWELPPGWTAGELEWPVPERLGTAPIVDYGYSNDMMLLTPVRANGPSTGGAAGQVAASVEWTVCSEVCLEGKARLSVSTPAPGSAAEQEKVLAGALARLPKPMPAAWRAHVEDTGSEFVLTVVTGRGESKATFFPETPEQVENDASQEIQSLRDGMRLRLRKSNGLLKPMGTLAGVLEIGGKGYEIHAPVRRQTGGRGER